MLCWGVSVQPGACARAHTKPKSAVLRLMVSHGWSIALVLFKVLEVLILPNKGKHFALPLTGSAAKPCVLSESFRSLGFNFSQHGPTTRPSRSAGCGPKNRALHFRVSTKTRFSSSKTLFALKRDVLIPEETMFEFSVLSGLDLHALPAVDGGGAPSASCFTPDLLPTSNRPVAYRIFQLVVCPAEQRGLEAWSGECLLHAAPRWAGPAFVGTRWAPPSAPGPACT